MFILPNNHLIFATAAAAQVVADANNTGEEDGWTYTVVMLPSGKAVVEITDEDGEKVGLI
jgi:hypothetical protein